MEGKKASEKIISVYWFAILFIVAGAVAFIVFAFSGPIDVRGVEAKILASKVAECFSERGYFAEGIFDKKEKSLLIDDATFLKKCHLNLDVEDFSEWKNDQYLVGVELYSFSEPNKDKLGEFSYGNFNLKSACILKGATKCSEKGIYILDEDKNPYLVKILASVRKTEKNEK